MPCPTILVAYNLFPFADEQMFCACARGLSDAKLFHTVYIVEDHDSGYAALTRF
jgi:hypothetical protein